MSEIGIRELKQRASQILREVREKGQTYTVTYRGKPCGVLAPHSTVSAEKKSKRKGTKVVSLRGILRGTPEVPWEEFLAAKKIWEASVDSLVKDLAKPGQGKEVGNGQA